MASTFHRSPPKRAAQYTNPLSQYNSLGCTNPHVLNEVTAAVDAWHVRDTTPQLRPEIRPKSVQMSHAQKVQYTSSLRPRAQA